MSLSLWVFHGTALLATRVGSAASQGISFPDGVGLIDSGLIPACKTACPRCKWGRWGPRSSSHLSSSGLEPWHHRAPSKRELAPSQQRFTCSERESATLKGSHKAALEAVQDCSMCLFRAEPFYSAINLPARGLSSVNLALTPLLLAG